MKTLFSQVFRSRCGWILLACGALVCPSLNSGDLPPIRLLNVDFGPKLGPSQKIGPAATGQTKTDFWNYYSRDNGFGQYRAAGALDHMKWADGTVSTVGMTVDNAIGCWGNGAADPMFEYYLYPGAPGNLTVVITDLPSGLYDFYIYGHGDLDNQNGVFQLSSGKRDQGTQSTEADGVGWRSAIWLLGRQFVVFNNVPVVNGEPVTIAALRDQAGIAPIAGIQIVKKDSPPLAAATAIRERRAGRVSMAN
jgi:hypothetical protein